MMIVGAGMAGLLAAAMLRNECTGIIEAQTELPNNHSAVLRFRSSVVGDVLNIPFRKVQVMKAVAGSTGNPIADVLSYSRKTNGTFTLRSPISARGELEERWIAPPDLIQQMADRLMCDIEYDTDFDDCWTEIVKGSERLPCISTLPMPVLMHILDWPEERPAFKSVPGVNINFDVERCDAHVSLYIPNPDMDFSRVSITGSRVTIECQFPDGEEKEIDEYTLIAQACAMLGNLPLPTTHERKRQQYAKILPIDDTVRKRFILWASEEHNIYSLGRFATWRPSLLLDDLVKDVRVIAKIASSGSYDHRK